MSDGFQHRDAHTTDQEEHVDGGLPRKRVGLFARDGLGSGFLELSAISTASGAVLSVTPSTGSSSQQTVYIGTPTLYAVVNTGSSNANVTLNPGPNSIGLVTSYPAAATTYIGLVSVSGNVAVSNFVAPNVGNVTLNPSPNQIGSVTVSNTVTSNANLQTGTNWVGFATVTNSNPANIGMTTLFGGPNQIGSVTVSNQLDIRSILSAPTLNVVTQAITVNTGMVTIFPGPNQIGSVTVSNTVPVTGTFWQATQPVSFGLVSLASGTEVRSLATLMNMPALTAGSAYIGLVTATIVGTINTGMTTLFPGPNQIGSVTVSNFTAPNVGNVTLNPSPNQIGSVTISNLPLGLVSNATVATTFIDNITLGQYGGDAKTSLVSGAFHPLQSDNSGYLSLGVGTRYIGLASVNIGGTLPALSAGANYIGLASVNVGNVVGAIATIAPRTDYIGLMSISGSVVNLAGSNYIGLVSVSGTVGVNSNVTLNSSPNYVGLVTTYQARSATTNFAGYISASGYSTVFVPPSGQRFFIHSVLINSKGVSDGFIGSSTNPMIPWTALATYGGFPYQHETPGLVAPATDQSLTIRQYSLVTISYTISTHFE